MVAESAMASKDIARPPQPIFNEGIGLDVEEDVSGGGVGEESEAATCFGWEELVAGLSGLSQGELETRLISKFFKANRNYFPDLGFGRVSPSDASVSIPAAPRRVI